MSKTPEREGSPAMKRIYDKLAQEGGGTWAIYMMMEIEEAFSVPLPEIEGGDMGDGAETITESAGRRRTELAIAEYLKVRDESMGTPDADNAERLQSAKDIHSLVIRQQGTRTRLSERNAAALAAPSASIEGETP